MKNCLRQIRRERDISQQELAEAVNTTRQTIHAIERHKLKTWPSYQLMSDIANYFGKNVEEIFFTQNVHQELQKSGHGEQAAAKEVS